MREIVFIQMGQCGNRIGEKFWETISGEHNIDGCGSFYGNDNLPYQRLNVYYEFADNARFVPRCVACDLENTQILTLRCSPIGRIFNPDYFITGSQGAGNNWAKGFYTEGAELMDCVLDVTRRQAEDCDCLQGFQMVHSIGGGTGSGMGSLLINRLRDEYEDRIINTFSIVPSERVSETVVEPYNSILTIRELVNHADESVVFDNEALFDICLNTMKLCHPKLTDLNHLISMTMAGVTTCFRYPGQLNTDLRKLLTNMCPYPKLHFFIPGYSPLNLPSKEYRNITVTDLVTQVFDPNCQMAAYDRNCGKYLTCAAIFRGLLSTKEIEEAMVEVQASNPEFFTKWIPNNIKTAICDVSPKSSCTSATLLANTSAITLIFQRLLEQFNTMFEKRAYVHWYTGEGMEEQEFCEAKCVVEGLCDDYLDSCDYCEDDCCLPQSFLSYDDECCSNMPACCDSKCSC